MNISVSKAPAKKTKGFALGLNARGAGAAAAFGGGDDDDDDSSSQEEGQAATGREAVNRAIAKEQAALRARAVAAAAAGGDAAVYDYDGAYESFHIDAKKKESAKADDPRQSRYTGDLLKAAEQRKRERDIAYERKVARDQAAEEAAEPEFRGKEKFVTAAYKRKLEERKVWQAQDEEQRKIEEENDVTKRTDGVGMASFYGNLTKNVAMGGGKLETNASPNGDDEDPRPSFDDPQRVGFLDGHDRAKNRDEDDIVDGTGQGRKSTISHSREAKALDNNEIEEDALERRKRMRLLRERKVEAARARYFQRQSMATA
jgi:coiled-coil domain-containing protein 55